MTSFISSRVRYNFHGKELSDIHPLMVQSFDIARRVLTEPRLNNFVVDVLLPAEKIQEARVKSITYHVIPPEKVTTEDGEEVETGVSGKADQGGNISRRLRVPSIVMGAFTTFLLG